MQQIFKTYHPFKWMIPALAAAVLFAGCSNEAPKTEIPPADSTASKMTVPVDTLKGMKDSLPPIDTSAVPRPDTRKAKKP